jgi:hypothetical protein
MTQHGRPQRRHVRKVPAVPLAGEVAGRYGVRVLDVSLGGARLRHNIVLRANDSCVLRVTLNSQPLTLLGRIVWSREVRGTAGTDSRTVFESGVAFDRLSQDARAVLAKFLGEPSRPMGWRASGGLPGGDAGPDGGGR